MVLGLWMRTSLVESPAKAAFLSQEERDLVIRNVSRLKVQSWNHLAAHPWPAVYLGQGQWVARAALTAQRSTMCTSAGSPA